MKRIDLSVCLIGCALLPGCMEFDDPVTTSQETHELIDSELDLVHDYNLGVCVGDLGIFGSCRGANESDPNVAWCTATLIAPTVALTSRRCLELAVPGNPNDCSRQFSGVLKDTDIYTTGNFFVFDRNHWNPVVSVHVPGGNDVCTDDLAVIVLERRSIAEPAGSNNEPADVDLTRDLVASPAAEVALVGRGPLWERYDPVTHQRIELEHSSTRRSVQDVTFVCAPGATGDCTIVDHWSSPPTFAPPPGLFAYAPSGTENDGGAGVFDQAEFGAGTSRLIGIHTGRTMAPDGTLSGGYAVRLDQHADLLRKVARQAAAAGGYAPPVWAR